MKARNQTTAFSLLQRIGLFSIRYRWAILIVGFVFFLIAAIGSSIINPRTINE